MNLTSKIKTALALVLLGLTAASTAPAALVVAPWIPIFKGIDRAVGTNFPTSYFTNNGVILTNPTLQVVNCLRIDLLDPDVQLFTTPRAPSYTAGVNETLSLSISNFVKNQGVKVATAANWYQGNPGGNDPTSEGLPCTVYGLLMTTGTVVSAAETGPGNGTDNRFVSMLFTTNKAITFLLSNAPPGTNTTGIYTAVSGYYPILTNGVILGEALKTLYPDSSVHDLQPRTLFGLSQDRHYLYMMVIDGRQSGYSDGANDADGGMWMLLFGAADAVNMDGGGSAAMYMADCAGNPQPLGHSSYVASKNRERITGNHLGIHALPLDSFNSNIAVAPGSTTATITWTTPTNATSQVEYGLTTAYGTFSPLDSTPVTAHSVTLSGLNGGVKYYYRVISTVGLDVYPSACGTASFTTTNAGVAQMFGLTADWKWETNNLDGIGWQARTFDDSGWTNHGPGALWADNRTTPPNINSIPNMSTGTRIPKNPTNAYPYTTYYFRRSFVFPGSPSGITLTFSNFIDDGAVFYLNGTEIYRTNMIDYPTPVSNSSNAIFTLPNCGDALVTCPLVFVLSGNPVTNLVSGTNVLAVSVHNYRNPLGGNPSPDIVFESALFYTLPAPPANIITNLLATPGETNATITWTTTTNATTQLQYGLTPALGSSNTLNPALLTSHSVTLSNLQPLTSYYFRAISSAGGFTFTTDGTFSTVPFLQPLVTEASVWKYTTNNLTGTNWTAPAYSDAGWLGQGPALLYLEDNQAVSPRLTALPSGNGGLPMPSYYFRTHFTLTNNTAGYALVFTNFIDDGAVFYLNGREVQRVRMAASPSPVLYTTRATACPVNSCETTLDVPDVFRLTGNALTNLVVGDNVLAAEVHQFATNDTDIVFGSTLSLQRALVSETPLRVTRTNNIVCITWDGQGFTLQRTNVLSASAPWADVPGPVKTSPYCTTNPAATTFYRLRN